MTSDRLYVHVWLGGAYVPAGLLTRVGGGFTFGYGKRYLKNPLAFALAPSLPLRDHIHESQQLFPVFRDACPDRWGRKLVALRDGRLPEEIPDFELLWPLNTPYRMGALAFSPTLELQWQDGTDMLPTSLADIEGVQALVNRIDMDDDAGEDSAQTFPGLEMIRRLESSFSLGGGRPKLAAFLDGQDCIVKFGRKTDIWDEPLVEYATMQLAAACGIEIPPMRLIATKFGHVLCIRRFDRATSGPRHVISAFTLCQLAEDGGWGSYQNMAEHARRYGLATSGEVIFRRMLFNGLTYNLDDHPRNHAFFVSREGVTPTPLYDVVPLQTLYTRPELALACGRRGRAADFANFLSDVAAFGLRPDEAEQTILQMLTVVRGWEDFYRRHDCDDATLERLGQRLGLCLASCP